MAAAASLIPHLLIVSGRPDLPGLLEQQLKATSHFEGRRYQLRFAVVRSDFFANLAHRRVDLVLIDNAGIPGLAPKEALAAAHQGDPRKPVVVLGERVGDSSPLRLLHRGTVEYLGMEELEQLPQLLDRMLLGREGGSGAVSFEDQVQTDTGRMQENQRLISIGRLAGSIAHEINNPLESVANLLFLMEREPGMPAGGRSYLAMAQEELARAIQISKQTLNFYRESPDPVPVRMKALLEDVLALHARRISAKGLRVVRQFQSDEPINVFPGAMRQIFSNLVGNAIEASSENGSLCLRVRKSQMWKDAGGSGLRILIGDTGTGMSPEVRRRAGEPLFTTKGQEGTGLGLWVTRSIIEGYRGLLHVRSSTGKNHGTVFSVFLPTNLRPSSLAHPESKPPPMDAQSGPQDAAVTAEDRRDASSGPGATLRSA